MILIQAWHVSDNRNRPTPLFPRRVGALIVLSSWTLMVARHAGSHISCVLGLGSSPSAASCHANTARSRILHTRNWGRNRGEVVRRQVWLVKWHSDILACTVKSRAGEGKTRSVAKENEAIRHCQACSLNHQRPSTSCEKMYHAGANSRTMQSVEIGGWFKKFKLRKYKIERIENFATIPCLSPYLYYTPYNKKSLISWWCQFKGK